jgi:hypothetical protein
MFDNARVSFESPLRGRRGAGTQSFCSPLPSPDSSLAKWRVRAEPGTVIAPFCDDFRRTSGSLMAFGRTVSRWVTYRRRHSQMSFAAVVIGSPRCAIRPGSYSSNFGRNLDSLRLIPGGRITQAMWGKRPWSPRMEQWLRSPAALVSRFGLTDPSRESCLTTAET